ncbi:DNA translocase FtsK [uncultured Secundilactobacillus sp.]|uniref:DNA translocase FtsK n=1 Tax=uncultured Secundilactobacillus sp. TaxID=2813935 RepID=UPI00258CFE1E|nr:DNA translocase FtsK [uncultured Secundilactobacillus sp.]
MKHYDGPAFFRRYSNPDQKAPRQARSQKPRTRRSTPADSQSLEPIRRQPVQIKEATTGKASIPLESVGNPVKWESNAPFRLTTVPKQLPRRQRVQPRVDFEKLKQQFEKPDEQVLVFSTDQQGTPTLYDQLPPATAKFGLSETSETFATPSMATEVASESATANPVAQSTAPKASQPKLDDREIAAKKQAAIDRLKARALAKHAKKTAQHNDHVTNPIDESQTREANEHQPSESATMTSNQPNEAIVVPAVSQAPVSQAAATPTENLTPVEPVNAPAVESVQMSQPTTPSRSAVSHGLGHSLGDILNEEQNSTKQSDLALFQDKPLAPKPVVSGVNVAGYQYPDASLLNPPVHQDESVMDEWIEHQGEVLDETLQAFHVDAHVVDWTVGPTVTQFQVSLALGVKVNKITNLTDDLKLALAAKDIRIEAPIPGRTTVGIEIPNLKTRPVMLSEVVQSEAFKNSASPLTVALGVDLFGQPQVTDLRKMPHGLIAGATGSGKSVFINSLLLSLLYKATPAELQLILIDPKAVELAPYDGLPHLLSPVISDPKAAAAALKWAVNEMDERYERLAAGGVRNIEQFNDRAELTESYGLKMPYIVIVIDELADLMMTASGEVQDYIVRITQKARAAGIHLLVATQRPSVDIVTGVIKNNIPTRVAFMVSSQIDSRTILDSAGAERLLGKGDMLYLGNGAAQAMRLQGTFVEDEVDRVTDFVRTQGEPHYAFDPDGLLKTEQVAQNQDELMPEVLDYIVNESTVSTSKLQRVFSIGYNRAANLIDTLESKTYISGQNGSKPRDVFLTPKQLAEMRAPRTD